MGEVSLDGQIRPVSGVLPMALAAKSAGIETLFVPAENAAEATLARGPAVIGVGTVAEVAGLFSSGRTLALHMYSLSREGLHVNQAYATAVVLLVVVLLINFVSGKVAKKLTKK